MGNAHVPRVIKMQTPLGYCLASSNAISCDYKNFDWFIHRNRNVTVFARGLPSGYMCLGLVPSTYFSSLGLIIAFFAMSTRTAFLLLLCSAAAAAIDLPSLSMDETQNLLADWRLHEQFGEAVKILKLCIL